MKDKEYAALQKEVLQQFMSGKNLFGKGGALSPMLKEFIDTALEAEMGAHLDEKERLAGNKRNGKGKKTIKTSSGEIQITTPQDRLSSFDPEIVRKRQTILADNLEDKIIGLYGLGMSLRDISAHIEELYDSKISHSVLSEITDRIIPKVKAWQSRPLHDIYAIVWLDAMHFKVRHHGKVENRALYNIIGINMEGHKEILGCYVSESEGANFWLSVLTDLESRGLKDILIACIDNLSGFEKAIKSVYPKTEVQSCIVHQIRNSLKYVASKNQREFMGDLKLVYKADTRDLAAMELDKLDQKWGEKYPKVIESWRRNWDKLTTYFDYTKEIRTLIYTTNAVEGYHRQLRKVTKTKGAFPSDMALLKLVYLASIRIEEKWTQKKRDWALIIQQLAIRFEGRVTLDL